MLPTIWSNLGRFDFADQFPWKWTSITRRNSVARAQILVADDHEAMRNTIVQMLEREFDVVGAVSNGCLLLEAARRLKPDLCVVDISMEVMNGIEASTQLKRDEPSPKVLFLTIHEDDDFVEEALKTGAEGYVLKARMGTDLIHAVNELLAGRTFVSNGLGRHTKNIQNPKIE